MARKPDQETKKLKKRLALEGGRGRRPAELKALVAKKAYELRKSGWKLWEIGEALGLHQTTVGGYLKGDREVKGSQVGKTRAASKRKRRARGSAPIRRVEVRQAAVREASEDGASGRALVLSSGARVEGLSVEDVVELARRLS